MSATELATWLDARRADGRLFIVESEQAVTVSELSMVDVQAAAAQLGTLGWAFEVQDNEGTIWPPEDVTDAFAPYRLHFDKPPAPGAGVQLLTNTALAAWLSEQRHGEVWWVAALTQPFATWGATFAPWGTSAEYAPQPPTKDPRQLVRETSARRVVAQDIRPWLLVDLDRVPVVDPVFRTWARVAAPVLMRALCDEITPDGGRLMFRGPPRLQLEPVADGVLVRLGDEGFEALQSAAQWVFENRREAEMRHSLFTVEFARSAGGREEPAAAFRDVAEVALDGAKIAYQLGLLDLSRDTLKSLGDLRKAVSEEVGKTSDTARQTITAVAGALSVGLGLIAARLNSAIDHRVLIAVAGVVVGYVGLMALSGHSYLALQRRLRKDWRFRLYSFLTEPEYKSMVTAPLGAAARGFYWIAGIGIAMSCAVLGAVLTIPPMKLAVAPEQNPSASNGISANAKPLTKSSTPEAKSSAAR